MYFCIPALNVWKSMHILYDVRRCRPFLLHMCNVNKRIPSFKIPLVAHEPNFPIDKGSNMPSLHSFFIA